MLQTLIRQTPTVGGTRLVQDLTYGEVGFDLPETAPGLICCTLASFSLVQVRNVRVNFVSAPKAVYDSNFLISNGRSRMQA